jgi:hypothetical protein
VKPDENLNVVNTKQHEQQVNLHESPQDYNNNNVDVFASFLALRKKFLLHLG